MSVFDDVMTFARLSFIAGFGLGVLFSSLYFIVSVKPTINLVAIVGFVILMAGLMGIVYSMGELKKRIKFILEG